MRCELMPVLDASAFYAGVLFGSTEAYVTTPKIYEEISHIREIDGPIQILQETGRLQVVEPSESSWLRAKEAAVRAGDAPALSVGDISVLALAMQTDNVIITDDYAISNTGKFLDMNVQPVMTRGLRKAGTWIYWCPGCGARSGPARRCSICDTALRRKLVS